MLRITRLPHAVRLEGRLTRGEVDLVREALRSPDPGAAVIDLTSLSFLDEVGAVELADLQRRGFEVRGGSPFVRQLLEEVAS
jgi:anti-anti-sigma regulatory factor